MAESTSNAGAAAPKSGNGDFVSEGHRRSVELIEAALEADKIGDHDTADRNRNIAAVLARSMGESGRYPDNPFANTDNPKLFEHYRDGELARMRREMEIMGREADVSHGM